MPETARRAALSGASRAALGYARRVTRVLFADEDHGRDPLTGRLLGDPVVAVRAGIAIVASLVLAHVGLVLAWNLMRGRSTLAWVDVQLALAAALPIGSGLVVLAWRDHPARRRWVRVSEAALLAGLAWSATESWAFFNLPSPFGGGWWWALTVDFDARLPRIGGLTLGLIFASRQLGRHAVGVALVIPMVLGESLGQVLFWPATFSLWGTLLYSGMVMVLTPLAERAALRAAGAIRSQPRDME